MGREWAWGFGTASAEGSGGGDGSRRWEPCGSCAGRGVEGRRGVGRGVGGAVGHRRLRWFGGGGGGRGDRARRVRGVAPVGGRGNLVIRNRRPRRGLLSCSSKRLDAATTAGCRRAAWGRGHGQGVGEGVFGAPGCVRGMVHGAENAFCGKTSKAAEGASSGGEGWRRGVFAWWCRV